MFLFIQFGKHVHYDEKINPIDFGGLRSNVKVTIDIYGNKLVNKIETKPLCASSSNLAYMLAIGEDGPYWFWRSDVKGQCHNRQIWK